MSNRLYSAASRQKQNLERLKKQRDAEVMAEVKDKPDICKHSEKILEQIKKRENSAFAQKQASTEPVTQHPTPRLHIVAAASPATMTPQQP
jgi:hypothetical protein